MHDPCLQPSVQPVSVPSLIPYFTRQALMIVRCDLGQSLPQHCSQGHQFFFVVPCSWKLPARLDRQQKNIFPRAVSQVSKSTLQRLGASAHLHRAAPFEQSACQMLSAAAAVVSHLYQNLTLKPAAANGLSDRATCRISLHDKMHNLQIDARFKDLQALSLLLPDLCFLHLANIPTTGISYVSHSEIRYRAGKMFQPEF